MTGDRDDGERDLRRAIARHRREVECCRECGDAQVADALAKRKATADGRLWASIESEASP